jgi:hypothetical protein
MHNYDNANSSPSDIEVRVTFTIDILTDSPYDQPL